MDLEYPSSERTRRAQSTLRVLVVDDEPAMREVIARVLEVDDRMEVAGTAANCDEAVTLTAQTRPDVILLDLRLGPDERGTDIIPSLLVTSPHSMIGIMTALPAENEEAASLQAGAFVFYEKSMLGSLVRYLDQDVELFRRALAGERVVAPSSCDRRPQPPANV